MSPSSRRTWISILVASVIVVGVLAVAAVGGTVFFFYRHVNTKFTRPDDAATEFTQTRARFSGQQPLIEMGKGEQPRLHRELVESARAGVPPLTSLRVLAYDEDNEKLVNVTVPFWLLRLAPTNKKLAFFSDNGIDFDSDRVRLTLEDIERRGPGLILDQKDRRGAQVLIWTE